MLKWSKYSKMHLLCADGICSTSLEEKDSSRNLQNFSKFFFKSNNTSKDTERHRQILQQR